MNQTQFLDLMEYIQEPSRCQEGYDGHDQSREEEYKVVLDFSSYYIIDRWMDGLRKARPPASAGVWGVHNKAEILQFLLKIEEE